MAERHPSTLASFRFSSMLTVAKAGAAFAVAAVAVAMMTRVHVKVARFFQELFRPSLPVSKAVSTPSSTTALGEILLAGGTDPSKFGVGNAKSLDALLTELHEGSCRLETDTKGRVSRCVEPAFVEVNFEGKVLVERSQVLEDGRTRNRDFLLAEKRDPGDSSALATALRGFKEELGIDFKHGCPSDGSLLFRDDLYQVVFEEKDSASYPGLPCIYQTHYVRMDILSRGAALDTFSVAGLPACTAFETTEQTKKGVKRLRWEWVDSDIARNRGVKGFCPRVAPGM